MTNIYNYTLKELTAKLIELGYKSYLAKQIFLWIYRERKSSFLDFTNIKKETREKLESIFLTNLLTIVTKEEDDLTIKYLLELDDKNTIEAVVMRHDYGLSLCVSSQIGCNMACSFCESGTIKKVRNLETHEMVRQILTIENDLKEKISHVVIMGIGEPLDNYQNVVNFINIINEPFGLEIGTRHITLSTCGIVKRIYDLANQDIRCNLAVSLHAPNQKVRETLMPIAKLYPLNELLEALKYYQKKTNKRLTFEYIMIDNINDSEEAAKELIKIVKPFNCFVNIIPYNETSKIDYKRSNNEKIMKFYDIIKKENIDVTIRREFGKNISGACGQLKNRRDKTV